MTRSVDLNIPQTGIFAIARAISVSPDGEHVLASIEGREYQGPGGGFDGIAALEVAGDGSLTEVSGSPYDSGGERPGFQSVAVQPDQPPVASFDFTAPGDDATSVSFDAFASSDPDGSVARYDWDFGDGTTLADGGPSPSHSYGEVSDQQVTLTVTDDEGCSTEFVFTGQTASFNGSEVATETRSVFGPEIRKLAVVPKAFPSEAERPQLGRRSRVRIRLVLSKDARTRFEISPVGAAPRQVARGAPQAAFARNLVKGRNVVGLRRVIREHGLGPGRYRLLAQASDAEDRASAPQRTRFRILD
jgi:hypothetical protein